MKTKVLKNNSVPCPEGLHYGRIIRIIDVGTQTSEEFGTVEPRLRLSVECVDTRHQFQEGKEKLPFIVHKEYANKLTKKAAMRTIVESVLGIKLKEGEQFDWKRLIDKPCQVQVVHKEDRDGVPQARIANILAPGKGKTKPSVSETYLFDLDDFDKDVFDTFPDFLKKQITASPEFQKNVLLNEKQNKKLQAKKKK